MEGPFYLRIGTPGGELSGGEYRTAHNALTIRDVRAKTNPRWVCQVLSRDTDPPETGEVDWCAGCGREPVLTSVEFCRACQ